jgi:hypothetical protein
MCPVDIQRPILRDGFQELRMSCPHVEKFKVPFAMRFLKSQLDSRWRMI